MPQVLQDVARMVGLAGATVAGHAARLAPDAAGIAGVALVADALRDVYEPLGGGFVGAVLVAVAWRWQRP